MKVPLLPNVRAGITGQMPLSAVWYRFLADLVEYVRPISGVAVFSASTQVNVTLKTEQHDTDYIVVIEPSENNTFWISDKTEAGFRVNAATTSSATVRWTIRR